MKYAEEINYWKTGQSSPGVWMERATKQIENLGGKVFAEAFGKDANGKSAFMLEFQIDGDNFRVVFPVLPTKTGNERAARIQAATLLYHDIKAKALTASILGNHAAFFGYIQLPDGRSITEITHKELTHLIPDLLLGSGDAEIINGEFRQI